MSRPACRALFLLVATLVSLSAAASASTKSTNGLALEKNWKIQSSCVLTEKSGDVISSRKFETKDWIPASVPTTVLAAQLAAGEFNSKFKDPFYGMNLRLIPGTDYPIGKIFTNLPMSDGSPYKCSWWYRTEFAAPTDFKGKNIWLRFDGINYRANIWLNGKKIAASDHVAGAYRRYEFNVKTVIQPGKTNILAVETFAQTETDLGINFVDWNPAPADKSLGIWRKVFLSTSGPVTVRHPAVTTHFPDPSLGVAELTAIAELQNATNRPVVGIAEASIDAGPPLAQKLKLAPGEH